MKLGPAALIRLMTANLVLGREPLYGLGEWAARFEPALLGLLTDEVPVVNDDRAGRALNALFDADRGSLLTSVVLWAISEFGIDTHQLHNDSIWISVQSLFRGADGTPHRGKGTSVVTFGHSKDYRSDLKQLVWIRTVSNDGAGPILYRLANGNTSDVAAHIPTWDGPISCTWRILNCAPRGDGPHPWTRRTVRNSAARQPGRDQDLPEAPAKPHSRLGTGHGPSRQALRGRC